MGVILSKGQKVDLTKAHPGLSNVVIGLGWDINHHGVNYDLDASAFLLGSNNKVWSDNDFIFYNNPTGANGSVIYSGDNRTGQGRLDDEQIRVDLAKVPTTIQRIAFTITIHDAYEKRQNFGQISNAYVRVYNESKQVELLRFNLGRDFTIETAIVAADIYRHQGEWKFNAVGSGFQGGLAALCHNFGVTVDDEQTAVVHSNTSIQQIYQEPTPPSFQPFEAQSYGSQERGSYEPIRQSAYANNTQVYGQASSYNRYSSDQLQCMRCRSTNVRTGEKGFGIGKAAIGGLILGPVGLLGALSEKDSLK